MEAATAENATEDEVNAASSVSKTLTEEYSGPVVELLEKLKGEAFFIAFTSPSRHASEDGDEMPPPFSGGIVWDQEYDIEVHQLAKLLWAQKSPMAAEQHQLSKHFDVLTGDWVVSEGDAEAIVRTVTMRSSAPIVGEHTLTDRQELKRLGSMYVLKSASATNIRMLGARYFTTYVQTIIAGVGKGKTRIHASWLGEWERGKKPALLAGQVSGGAEKGVPTGYRQLHETLISPEAVERHWKVLQELSTST